MSLSENIRRIRLEKGMTQEQLAAKLGVSPQAVSKWETSDTYPDGSLLVPMAWELNVSLDELFDNNHVSMNDISKKIRRIISKTNVEERFSLVRDIGWQIERGLFNCGMEISEKYSADEIVNQTNSSYILNDYGFTMISNGKEPFFSVFPEPKEGFGYFAEDIDELQKIFRALSSSDTLQALLYLYKQESNYIFEPEVLVKECSIAEDTLQNVINDLICLRVVLQKDIYINGEKQTLCYSYPSHKLIALFLVAHEIGYKGAHSLQVINRTKPFLGNI